MEEKKLFLKKPVVKLSMTIFCAFGNTSTLQAKEDLCDSLEIDGFISYQKLISEYRYFHNSIQLRRRYFLRLHLSHAVFIRIKASANQGNGQ